MDQKEERQFHSQDISRKSKTIGTENRSVGRRYLKGHKELLGGDSNVLYLDCGGNCIMIWISQNHGSVRMNFTTCKLNFNKFDFKRRRGQCCKLEFNLLKRFLFNINIIIILRRTVACNLNLCTVWLTTSTCLWNQKILPLKSLIILSHFIGKIKAFKFGTQFLKYFRFIFSLFYFFNYLPNLTGIIYVVYNANIIIVSTMYSSISMLLNQAFLYIVLSPLK